MSEPDIIEGLTMTPIPGYIRITIKGHCFDKEMTPSMMRILAISLLQSAEEAEKDLIFLIPSNS